MINLKALPILAIAVAAMFGSVLLPLGAPVAGADPDLTSSENQFFLDLQSPMAHPPLLLPALVKMGHQACSDISSGVSPDVEKGNLQMGLLNQGINTSNADVGTLVHFALRDLCPDVPNSTGI
jgi:hypothetical protein